MVQIKSLAVLAAGVLLAVLAVSVPVSVAKRSKHLAPYKTFHFTYATKTPGKPTKLNYHVALKEQGAKAPVVKRLDLTFARGTKIDLLAVKPCHKTDAQIQAAGPSACPASGRIATGQAKVYIGSPDPLLLDATVSPTAKHKLVVVLAKGKSVIRILRGTFKGRTLTVKIPPLTVGTTRVALVAFKLTIGGGTKKKPAFRTPATCTKKGWDVIYAPTFEKIGKKRLVDTTKCKAA